MKNIKKWLCCLLATVTVLPVALTACNNASGSSKEYTIQYTDDTGVHTVTVKKGSVYTLESVPQRNGYEFLGLFDAEEGGKQYVNANGSALAVYGLSKDLILFPQWKAKEYTLVLDYQGAYVIGERQKTVVYGESITELPTGLSLANYTFTGWYTEPNGVGVQVGDKYGAVPQNARVTENTFDLSDENGYIYLYAGFTLREYTVTLCFAGGETETVKAVHGTDIKDIIYDTRVEGKGVLAWSTKENDTDKTDIFRGKIDKTLTLYATEYAPVIELDTDGGNTLAPIVAKAGASVSLPTPEKENYKFIEWQTEDGKAYTATTMPEAGVTLKAKWQAKLVFDENGGTEVVDISKTTGESIELPVPEKEGYIFAGWYTADKEKYEITKMPATGIALKAGWYEEKTAIKVLLSGDNSVKCLSAQDTFKDELTLNFSEYLAEDFEGHITVLVEWQEKNTDASQNFKKAVAVGFYSQRTVSEIYQLGRTYTEHDHKNYIDMEKSMTLKLTGNVIYVTIACSSNNTGWTYNGYLKDFRYTLTYPDTTKLDL